MYGSSKQGAVVWMNTEIIKSIYEDNCRWLVFAEAKHTVLLALNAALLAILFSKDTQFRTTKLHMLIMILCLCSLGISIYALLPFNNQNKSIKGLIQWYYGKRHTVSSVIFYKEIFLMGAEFPAKLKEELGVSEWSNMEYEWINQIVAIASVTMIKTALFKVTGTVLLTDILLLVFSLN